MNTLDHREAAAGAPAPVNLQVQVGDVVSIRPHASGDLFEPFFRGKTATVTGIEQDVDDQIYLAITVRSNPGVTEPSAHRFFFQPDEVHVLRDEAASLAKALPSRDTCPA
jgi:hypothetical protein